MMALKLDKGRILVLIYLLSFEVTCICDCGEKIVSTRIELVNATYTVSIKTPT